MERTVHCLNKEFSQKWSVYTSFKGFSYRIPRASAKEAFLERRAVSRHFV